MPYPILNSVTPDELKAWREKHRYTQVMLANALNVHPMTVSKWETGVNKEIPPFLPLALETLERRGGEKKRKGKGKGKEDKA